MSVSTKNEKPKINDKLVEQQTEITEELCNVKKNIPLMLILIILILI